MNTQFGYIYYQTWDTFKHEGDNQQVRHVVLQTIPHPVQSSSLTKTLPWPLLTAWQFLVSPDHQPPYQV
jgi:hypothetical protein